MYPIWFWWSRWLACGVCGLLVQGTKQPVCLTASITSGSVGSIGSEWVMVAPVLLATSHWAQQWSSLPMVPNFEPYLMPEAVLFDPSGRTKLDARRTSAMRVVTSLWSPVTTDEVTGPLYQDPIKARRAEILRRLVRSTHRHTSVSNV